MAEAVDQVDRDGQQREGVGPQLLVVARRQREAGDRQVELRDAAQAVGAAQELPVRGQRHRHHAHGVGDQREHELAQPQRHQADQQCQAEGHQHGAGQRAPAVEAGARGQQRRGVAARGEEHRVREADLAEVGDDHVQPVGHHREDRDQHRGAVDRAAAAQQRRGGEDRHAHQRQGQGAELVVGEGACHVSALPPCVRSGHPGAAPAARSAPGRPRPWCRPGSPAHRTAP